MSYLEKKWFDLKDEINGTDVIDEGVLIQTKTILLNFRNE